MHDLPVARSTIAARLNVIEDYLDKAIFQRPLILKVESLSYTHYKYTNFMSG